MDISLDIPPTILVVEDDPSISELIQLCLGPDGYFFRRVFNGKAGIDAAKREKPALIIMDVMMPQMDGYTAAGLMAADPEIMHIPVLILTSKRDMRDAFSSPNIVGFLEKPFDPLTIRETVKKILSR